MNEEMRGECLDAGISAVGECCKFCKLVERQRGSCCSTSCRRVRAEKYPENMELACKMVKETLDKKYGAPWHVRICGSALRSLSAPDA